MIKFETKTPDPIIDWYKVQDTADRFLRIFAYAFMGLIALSLSIAYISDASTEILDNKSIFGFVFIWALVSTGAATYGIVNKKTKIFRSKHTLQLISIIPILAYSAYILLRGMI